MLGENLGQRRFELLPLAALDIFANETMKNALNHTGRVCAMASEEDEALIPVLDGTAPGRYAVLFDPKRGIDGSAAAPFAFLAPGDRYNLRTGLATRPGSTESPLVRYLPLSRTP